MIKRHLGQPIAAFLTEEWATLDLSLVSIFPKDLGIPPRIPGYELLMMLISETTAFSSCFYNICCKICETSRIHFTSIDVESSDLLSFSPFAISNFLYFFLSEELAHHHSTPSVWVCRSGRWAYSNVAAWNNPRLLNVCAHAHTQMYRLHQQEGQCFSPVLPR